MAKRREDTIFKRLRGKISRREAPYLSSGLDMSDYLWQKRFQNILESLVLILMKKKLEN